MILAINTITGIFCYSVNKSFSDKKIDKKREYGYIERDKINKGEI